MQTIIQNRIIGILSWFHVSDNGIWKFIRKDQNEIMYTGADIMARALVAEPGIFVRGMYLEYNNDGIFTPPAVDRTRTPAYYEALSGQQGYIRVPLTARPGYTSSDAVYPEGNIVTVQAQTDGTTENGPGIIDNTTEIYAAALVVMPDPTDKTKDIVFSASNCDVPVPKIANAQVGIKWDVKFL